MQDLRFALRQLLKNPGFTAVAMLTLALGIGANTAIFSVLKALVWDALPYRDPEQLVAIWASDTRRPASKQPLSYPDFEDWRARSKTFAQMAAWYTWDYTVTGGAEPLRVRGAVVSRELFELLGVPPQLGRGILTEDDKPGNRIVILSHGLWERRFNSDPDLPGQSITLNGQSYVVAGVMPRRFQFPVEADPVEVWTTITMAAGNSPVLARRDWKTFFALGRLKPGVRLEEAQTELATLAAGLSLQHPKTNQFQSARVVPAAEEWLGEIRHGLLILFGAVACVLLIACTNVANLFLAKATVRHREMAVRAALGANRARIVRQLLTESTLLALGGGLAGGLFAWWGVDALFALNPAGWPHTAEVRLDERALTFTLLVSLATGLLFGLVPAWQSAKTNLCIALQEGGRTAPEIRGGTQWRNALVVAEIALALVLLTGAGLLLNSFWRLRQVPPGFDARNVLAFRMSLPYDRYDGTQVAEFYRQFQTRLQSLPGVRAASAALPLPMTTEYSPPISFKIQGRELAHNERPVCDGSTVQPGYFRTLGIQLIAGRDFGEHDDTKSPPVALINQTLARRYFPNENPVGRRLRIIFNDAELEWREIIGVVADVKYRRLNDEPRPRIYATLAQDAFHEMYVAVKTDADPRSVIGAVRAELRALDRDQPIYDVRTLEQRLGASLARPRFSATLLALFGGLAVVLTAVGLYGVMSYTMAQRTHEIGVRMALGAGKRDVLRSAIGQGLRLAVLGVSLGLIGSLALTRSISTLLYEVSPTDPATFAAVSAGLILVALTACYVPARRAANVDPMEALRHE